MSENHLEGFGDDSKRVKMVGSNLFWQIRLIMSLQNELRQQLAEQSQVSRMDAWAD